MVNSRQIRCGCELMIKKKSFFLYLASIPLVISTNE